MLRQFKQKEVPQPEVFRYGVYEMVGGIAYEFVFYDGFFAHCWGEVPTKEAKPSEEGL
jgi:hypothetical protein